jgi:uncharacterized damage-inducible protein DinB
MPNLLADFTHDFRRHKSMTDRALTPLTDEEFFRRPGEAVNPIALIVKHIAGNLRSRWTDFLTTDGDKPDRDRDNEFVLTADDTRGNLQAAWERGWQALFNTLASLQEADLGREVTIRGEVHTAFQALLRSATHTAYHTGQIVYLARLWRPEGAWLTIAPGQSRSHRVGGYLKPHGA